MTITFFTKLPAPSFPRLESPRPTALAEFAERLTIERAEQPSAKVLLLTGAKPHLVIHSEIRCKPGAMQIEIGCKNWPDTLRQVEKFCAGLDDLKSKAYAAGARHKAVVIINDADYFLAGNVSEGLLTRTCDKVLLGRIKKMERLVESSGGELILMAVLEPDSTTQWREKCEELGWNWKPYKEFQKELLSIQKSNVQHSVNEQTPIAEMATVTKEAPDKKKVATFSRTASKKHHEAWEQPPPDFCHGPLAGTKEHLGTLLRDDKVQNPRRRLDQRARRGMIWVKEWDMGEYRVWFRDRAEYDLARERQLKNGN